VAYFIDTNIFVACLRGRAPQARARFLEHLPWEIRVPFQVAAELKLGAAKSARQTHHTREVKHILSPFVIAWPDPEAIDHYVDIRASLEKAGTSISQPDLWIAAITRAAGGVLVTQNLGEFTRVPGLTLENWLDA
jgi:tRNA(fMet)-specific endonuclease VapC